MNIKQHGTAENNLRPAELPAQQSETVSYANSGSLVSDACSITNAAGELVQRTVNWVLVQRNWLLGKRIAEEELKGGIRAEYGAKAIRSLAQELTRMGSTTAIYTNTSVSTRRSRELWPRQGHNSQRP